MTRTERIANIENNIARSEKVLADILTVGVRDEGDVSRVQILRQYIQICREGLARTEAEAQTPTNQPQPWWKGLSITQQRKGLRDLRLAEAERRRIDHGYTERRLTHVRPVYIGNYR